jgi:hypothetical protein
LKQLNSSMPEQTFEKPIIPEAPSQPSTGKEQVEGNVEIEKKHETLEKQIAEQEKQAQVTQTPIPTTPTVQTAPAPVKTEERKKIEGILSEDLKELFQGMDAEHKAEFKRKGEETASALEKLVSTAKATAKKVAKLISNWLKFIPGINQYFLEQEAKLKTDKILEINKEKEEGKQ